MNVKPFTLVGASALAAVQASLGSALRRWAADWGVDSSQASVQAVRAWDYRGAAPAGAWTGAQLAKGNAWLAWHPKLGEGLERLLFRPDPGQGAATAPHFARKGASEALASLTAALGTALASAGATAADDGPAAALYARASGAVLAVISVGHGPVQLTSHVLLDEQAVRALAALLGTAHAAALPPLARVDLGQALDSAPVALALTVGTTRLSLGRLMTLEEGDVIRLDSTIEQPVTLTGPGGAALLSGFLGKVDGQLAVELARP